MEEPAQTIHSKVANFSVFLGLEHLPYGIDCLGLAPRDEGKRRQFFEVGEHRIFGVMEVHSLRARLDALLDLLVPHTHGVLDSLRREEVPLMLRLCRPLRHRCWLPTK